MFFIVSRGVSSGTCTLFKWCVVKSACLLVSVLLLIAFLFLFILRSCCHQIQLFSSYYSFSIRYVTLKRGPKGLGFSVAGGKGSPNGDLPICIRTISSECTAARDGRIRQGDIILSVNGISFENISHKVAVETLTRFHGDITLKISSS